MESRSRRRAVESVQALLELRPKQAMLLTDEGETPVALELLHPGDRIRVRPGETLPRMVWSKRESLKSMNRCSPGKVYPGPARQEMKSLVEPAASTGCLPCGSSESGKNQPWLNHPHG